ncbi:hypothetical protein AUR59_020330 [Stutzerimonas balearica]|uniref:hypothetical protein n=1 Tax=Stutzerimonas balearica TaxID=74829 RepID=UPI0009713789|nr:hypothetical protein [Stutzerimonas balearica]OMG61508.1 hypothetical protein AUR59_020330 [Stutzerimonas balearica]
MQHTDKAIAEFEAWWDRQPHREQFEDVKEQMRNVWLESRRELVIELPPGVPDNPKIRQDRNKAISDCRAAIEAAGVTVRG